MPHIRTPSLLALLAGLAVASTPAFVGAFQRPSSVECRDVNECRQLALEAAARGAYETFHDLAWRAIQTGQPNDPELLYLLARAQSLSNRPHDALVVLRRLVNMGVVFDAATHEDLRRARNLPGWRALEVLINKIGASESASAGSPSPLRPPTAAPAARGARGREASEIPGAAGSGAPPSRESAPSAAAAPVAASPDPAPPAAAAAIAPPAAVPPTAPRPIAPPVDYDLLPIEEALRFPIGRFVPGGLAYDAVSARFILGSVQARALIVVGDGSSSVTDLVRADSTGFKEVAALEIDRRRGDLWVVSTAADGATGVLHKLQLISGRNLAAFDVSAGPQPVRLVDVAVTAAGTVLVLDSGGRRILRLRSGSSTVDELVQLDAEGAGSLAATDDERAAYVAIPAGLVRVDVPAGTASPVTGPQGLDLGGIERLRWHRGALIAVQAQPDGTRRIVRLRLSRTGRAIVSSTVLHAAVPASAGPTFATVVDDELYFLVAGETGSTNASPAAGGAEVVVQRMRLR